MWQTSNRHNGGMSLGKELAPPHPALQRADGEHCHCPGLSVAPDCPDEMGKAQRGMEEGEDVPAPCSSTYVVTSVLGPEQDEPLEPQAAQRVGALVQLAIPAATCPCLPCRSIDYAWWPLMGPFPWMVTLHPCRRSVSSPLDMGPWSLWMNVTPLASWGLQDGGNN